MKGKHKLTFFEFTRRTRLRVFTIVSAAMFLLLGAASMEFGVTMTFSVAVFLFVNGFSQLVVSPAIEEWYKNYQSYWHEQRHRDL